MDSDVMEDYLKGIYELERDGDGPVGTSELADQLGVTPPTVSKMLDKLAARDLVEREKYAGVTLTPEGHTVALEVLRHHRLIEAYLAEALDYEWTDVHDEADNLEHHISEEFERAVAEALDDPTVDPHGDPIPGADLQPVDDDSTALADAEHGERVVVARISDRDDEVLAYLAANGVQPGVELAVRAVDPVGLYVVATDDGELRLPPDVVDDIRVRPVDGDPPADDASDGDGDAPRREGDDDVEGPDGRDVPEVRP
jgi:DtxR family Mn-dependent transcriptional regulator